MATESDRRGTERVSLMASVTIDHGTGPIDATCMDLSISGISVWAPYKAPPGALVLYLTLGEQELMLQGRVAREFESDGGSVWGIEFFGLDDRARALLKEHVTENPAA